MGRLINADHVIRRATDPSLNDLWDYTSKSTGDFIDYINREETVEAREVTYATWVPQSRDPERHQCSNCMYPAGFNPDLQREDLTPLCPMCGSMMSIRR